MGDSTSLFPRAGRMLPPGMSPMWWGIPLASSLRPSTPKLSLDDIMLPERFHLRVSESSPDDMPWPPGRAPRRIANWPAYKFGVETMLRAHGLEEHVTVACAAAEPDAQPRMERVGSQQWAAEEEVCKAIIGFNVRDFSEIFGESPLGERSAGEIWRWLSGLNKERAWAGMKEQEGGGGWWQWW